jgi:hypothetical protein
MTVQLVQFCSSLQLLQSFFQNIALKGYLTQRWMATTVSILQKKLSYEVYIYSTLWATKKWNVHFDLSLKLSQGKVHDFSGDWWGAKIPTGDAERSQGRCAPPLKIRHGVKCHTTRSLHSLSVKSPQPVCEISTACLWNLHSLREILLLVLCNAGLQISAGHRTLSGQFLHFVRSKLFMTGHVTGPICAGQVSNLKKLFI